MQKQAVTIYGPPALSADPLRRSFSEARALAKVEGGCLRFI